MPNQNNYRTDLTIQTDPRYTTSRIIRVPDATILLEEVPANFAFDRDDNIEVHFYTAATNQLLLSTVISISDDIIKSHVVSYSDSTYKNYLRIDFTKMFVDKNLVLIPGDYRMVLNFFSNEIGSYTDRKLNIDVISDTRTEIQLSFNDTIDDITYLNNLYLLNEFVEKGFNKSDAVGTAEKIFVSGVELNDPNEGLTATNIESNIAVPFLNQTAENSIDRIEQVGLKEIFDTQLNNFLPELYKILREEIVINGDERIQASEFKTLIETVVRREISRFSQIVDSRIKVT